MDTPGMAPPVFICASDAGHDERSPMRVYGALWAMSTIAIEWTSGVGYPSGSDWGHRRQAKYPDSFPSPRGREGKGRVPTVSSLILGPLPDGREVSSAICKGGHW
jgi:hypothetical protein